MKKRTKHLVSLLVAAVTTTSLFVGCGANENPGDTIPDSTAQINGHDVLFDKPVHFNIMIPSHASYPFQEDWYVLDLIKEYTNVDFKITAVETGGFDEKLNLAMSSGELPDMISMIGGKAVQQYAPQGAFINIMEYMDQMPNFKKWYDEHPDIITNYLSADGGLYQFPVSEELGETDRRGWLIRQDILEKEGLSVPTTKDELYDVLVALKKAYPDSYPMVLRSMNGNMEQLAMLSYGWGTGFMATRYSRFLSYDYDKKEWYFGATTPEFKEMLEFYAKLYKEGLMIPNVLTLNTQGWQDAIANSDSFITVDYLSRIDFFNNSMRASNPDFTMAYMKPPVFNEKVGDKFAYCTEAKLGYAVASTTKNLDEVLKYIDWLYTDEAEELLTWGRPNELYTEAADGTRTWKNFTTAAEMKKGTGFETYGMYQRVDFAGELATFSPECKAATLEAKKHDLPMQPQLAYTSEEQNVIDTIGTNIATYVCEQVSKFLLGERSFDTWDAYVQEVENLGLDQLKAVHESSYTRALENQSK